MLSAQPAYSLARATFKRAQRGLFGGKHIQFGNNNPFSKKKTRRNWLPNVQSKNIYSESLSEFIKLKVTTSVLRTIDKKGGLDKYLLDTKDKNLFSEKAVELKNKIINHNKLQSKKVSSSSEASTSA
ncbi:ribosomal L28 family-domain-containing protein [Choanephora cucurbitarum]|uniref:Large ribosomal subunit protein bL28m n=1 Tax=Choanephora cucurbitarum TaxID=101091 RepID=A0A1C7N7C3_9FUNG|nr:ribosomal L28 family-domain-containing protein [Choanephora cucurbitarum]OBZ84526.1 54S ribosomal protein L24, mitochondrial [Choanephora cucurbitarum]